MEKDLRKDCLKLLKQSGLDKTPRYWLAHMISPEASENPQALSMALTGYRQTKSAQMILKRLHAFLTGQQVQKAGNF